MLKKQPRLILVFLVVYLLIVSVIFRANQEPFTPGDRRLIAATLIVYFILVTAQPFLTARHKKLFHLYLVLQILDLLVLMIFPTEPFDYFAVLCLPLCYQTMLELPQKTAYRWAGVILFCITAALVEGYGWLAGIGFAAAYIAVGVFISALGFATAQAERAQREARSLLAELQVANQKLQQYSDQVKDLATAQERNRLARELHDSVTQTIFGMVLTAQSARILQERDPARVTAQLDHLQELAQNALSEMRTLIQQLRPKTITADGLVPALKKHFFERQTQEGLTVELQVDLERRLPEAAEEGLFRVIQEALNNVSKHANTRQAAVQLNLRNSPFSVLIEDHGCGFDPQQAQKAAQHVGLASMAERVKALGGTLTVESSSGCGTRVRIENLIFEER
jgi:signal transduction histidine kinase